MNPSGRYLAQAPPAADPTESLSASTHSITLPQQSATKRYLTAAPSTQPQSAAVGAIQRHHNLTPDSTALTPDSTAKLVTNSVHGEEKQKPSSALRTHLQSNFLESAPLCPMKGRLRRKHFDRWCFRRCPVEWVLLRNHRLLAHAATINTVPLTPAGCGCWCLAFDGLPVRIELLIELAPPRDTLGCSCSWPEYLQSTAFRHVTALKHATALKEIERSDARLLRACTL